VLYAIRFLVGNNILSNGNNMTGAQVVMRRQPFQAKEVSYHDKQTVFSDISLTSNAIEEHKTL